MSASQHDGTAEFVRAMGPVARALLGEPNASLSTKQELRWGNRGSFSVRLDKGTWFDNEAGEGGGVLDLVQQQRRVDKPAALDWLREQGHLPTAEMATSTRGEIVATYDYRDERGELLFQVCRFDPKDFRQRRPDASKLDGWNWSTKGVRRVLFRLPQILEAVAAGRTIYVVEGEKAALALEAIGLDATCSPGGAGKWHAEYGRPLAGADVVVLPDCDPQATNRDGSLRWHEDGRPVLPGQDHAADIARQLAGVAKRVRVLMLPGLPEKGDVVDWLAAGGTWQQLDELADDLFEIPPETIVPDDTDNPLPLLMFADIKPVLTASDFVQGTLVRGSSAVVYGDSNAGKTFWVTDLALHVAAAMRWNGRRVDGGAVIYAVLEGGNGFQNRVAAWGKQHGAPSTLPFAAIPASINLLDPDCDVPRFIAAIKAAARALGLPVKLVVIDTLSRAMAGANENDSADMGALVRSMDSIRQATAACVLFVHHSGKDAAKGARGHSLLRAAIDTEIEVKVDETTGNRTATVVKQRDLSKGSSFGFRLEMVTLGNNEHDEAVTTCTVVGVDAAPGREVALTQADKGWLRDLTDMFAEKASAMSRSHSSTTGHAQDATLTLTRDEVRAGFREKGRFDTENPDTALTGKDRERMRAALTRLKDRGKIGMTSSLVWLIHPRQAASDARQT